MAQTADGTLGQFPPELLDDDDGCACPLCEAWGSDVDHGTVWEAPPDVVTQENLASLFAAVEAEIAAEDAC